MLYIRYIFLTTALFSSTLCYAETSDILSRLQKLEEIRLTDYKRFRDGVAELDVLKQTLRQDEAYYLTLLKGYERTLAGDYAQAIQYSELLMNTVDAGIYSFRARVLAVNLYVLSRDYLKAFITLGDINQQLDLVDDIVAKTQAVANIAMLYNSIERYDISLFYSERFLGSVSDERLVCRVLVHKLSSLLNLEKSENFFTEIDNGINTCKSVNEKIPELIMYRDKMQAISRTGSFPEVIAIYNTIARDVEATGYPILIAGTLSIVARSYLALGELEQARLYATEALNQIKNLAVSQVHVEIYEILSQLEKLKGDYKKALDYFEQLAVIEKQYADDKTRQQLAFHQAEGELATKNQRIALLDKDNELLSLQKDLYEQELKQNRLITIVLLSILVLASFLAYRGMSGRKRFKKIAEYDQLTGISNRYHFNNQAKVALEYCEKNAKPVAVILFDLDYFKNINDMHGHAAGDWALQQVVKTCRNFMRNNDVFGRIGGEEFAVVLPGCQTDKAVLLAEICRDAIAGIDSTDCGKQFPLSASFGVCGSDTSGYQLKQLLADADNAMYGAKEAGRDQVMAFAP
jgi:diguanylate cyclase (GGDEF)-like protein